MTRGGGGAASASASASAGWPLFHNQDLSRRLDVRGISEVLRWMSGRGDGDGADDKGKEKGKSGRGGAEGRAERLEGEEETGEVGGTYWIFWRTPEEWAGVLLDWIERTGQKGSVLTLYEIAEGEASLMEGLYIPLTSPFYFFHL